MKALRSFSAAVLLLLVAMPAAQAQGLVSRYVEGEHYKRVAEPVAQPQDGKTRVIEFFLYSCPHCYRVEPKVERWRAELGDGVLFSRVPVLFGAGGEAYARLFYTARKLGVLDPVHSKIFDAIHRDGRRLTSPAAMREFMVAQGVDGERFDEVFESEAVSDKLRDAARLMRAYQVTATPSLGIDGQYYVSGRTAGSNERMFDVAEYLIDKARSAR